MINKQKTAILIVFYNDLSHILRLANVLRAIRNRHKNFISVYALDNNKSGVDHCKIFQQFFPWFKKISHTDNLGFAAGNNLLARYAIEEGCAFLWILNPDMEPEVDSLEKMLNTLNQNLEIGAVGPTLLFGKTKNNPVIQLMGGSVDYSTQKKINLNAGKKLFDVKLSVVPEVSLLNTGSILIRSEIVKVIGLFEEDYFMYNDEIDLMYRIYKSGFKVAVVPDALVWHHHDWSPLNKVGYHRMYYYMNRNKLLYDLKHFGILKGLNSFAKQLLLFPFGLKFCIKTAGWSLAYFYYRGFFDGIRGRKGLANIRFE